MKSYNHRDYQFWDSESLSFLPTEMELYDHLNGFDSDGNNTILEMINSCAVKNDNFYTVVYHNILSDDIKSKYTNLTIKFDPELQDRLNLSCLMPVSKFDQQKYFNNFICSFNGSEHVSRQFLVSALKKFDWFNSEYCTKNFQTSRDKIDGNISNYFDDVLKEQLYRKFLLTDNEEFYKTMYTNNYVRHDHKANLQALQPSISSSFVQIVSETVATSYYPFVTEKFLYPTLLKTLWVSYAQPNWHSHLEIYYGFKKYNKIFNYDFDHIENPVIRLVELLSMISKFEKLSKLDWHDLYLMEQETIEFNYDWFCSKKYLNKLKNYG